MHGREFACIFSISWPPDIRPVNTIKSRATFMNSKERHEARYQRRKAKRKQKETEFIDSLGTFSEVFSYEHLYDSFKQCKKGIRWKASIQAYESNLSINTYDIWHRLDEDKWKTKGFTKFMLSERGKLRLIQSVHISERCIQRTLCDWYLVPLLQRSLIYDNGASIQGKGTKFAVDRLKLHLHRHYRRYGNEGYILLYDFTNYFGSIPHDKLYKLVDPKITDDRIRKLFHQLIDAFDEGLGLGSQVSQISAVYFANTLDHLFKDQMGIKGYARFMDDGYIISDSLEELKKCEQVLYEECGKLGIIINPKKIRICKLSHGFTFLKKRYTLDKSGKITIRMTKKAFKAVKRRLKRMYEKKLPYKTVYNSYMSWRGSTKEYKCYRSVQNIDRYYNRLFVDEERRNA